MLLMVVSVLMCLAAAPGVAAGHFSLVFCRCVLIILRICEILCCMCCFNKMFLKRCVILYRVLPMFSMVTCLPSNKMYVFCDVYVYILYICSYIYILYLLYIIYCICIYYIWYIYTYSPWFLPLRLGLIIGEMTHLRMCRSCRMLILNSARSTPCISPTSKYMVMAWRP